MFDSHNRCSNDTNGTTFERTAQVVSNAADRKTRRIPLLCVMCGYAADCSTPSCEFRRWASPVVDRARILRFIRPGGCTQWTMVHDGRSTQFDQIWWFFVIIVLVLVWPRNCTPTSVGMSCLHRGLCLGHGLWCVAYKNRGWAACSMLNCGWMQHLWYYICT